MSFRAQTIPVKTHRKYQLGQSERGKKIGNNKKNKKTTLLKIKIKNNVQHRLILTASFTSGLHPSIILFSH